MGGGGVGGGWGECFRPDECSQTILRRQGISTCAGESVK